MRRMKMNKKYVTPEMEITEFETEDVISASGGGPEIDDLEEDT